MWTRSGQMKPVCARSHIPRRQERHDRPNSKDGRMIPDCFNWIPSLKVTNYGTWSERATQPRANKPQQNRGENGNFPKGSALGSPMTSRPISNG